jgi:hypothetical protein
MQANNKESTLQTASFLTMLLMLGERTAAGLLQFTSLVIYLSMSLGPITIWRA